MDLDIVFLGTSASAPTAQRAPAALLVRRGGDRLLFDCGEGTQRQLMRSTLGLPDLQEIFLTHFHADHYLGLPGMLKTFSLRQRELPLTIYGPAGLRELYKSLGRIIGKLSYPVELEEVRPGEAPRALMLYAKTARGLMARFAIDHRIDRAERLKAFATAGYGFNAALSSTTDWVFTRLQPPPKNPRTA